MASTSRKRRDEAHGSTRDHDQDVSQIKAQAQAAATAAWSPEDRAWELLLAISGAHAEAGLAGRSDLRRLAAEAKRLLAEFPVEAEAEPPSRQAMPIWLALKAVITGLWGFLCFVVTLCHDIGTVLAAAALGQEPAEENSRESSVDRSQAKHKAQPHRGRVISQANGVHEEEESVQRCHLS
ncbi:unnamed protein product [Durusdinium trenchii]|uniref:Uncharacterized protein n=1 Tax=Durusdinium trenchii TaxID=1381693 RepID=A0ABP0NPD3_9DINO